MMFSLSVLVLVAVVIAAPAYDGSAGHADDGSAGHADDGSAGHADDGSAGHADDGSAGHADDGSAGHADDGSAGHADEDSSTFKTPSDQFSFNNTASQGSQTYSGHGGDLKTGEITSTTEGTGDSFIPFSYSQVIRGFGSDEDKEDSTTKIPIPKIPGYSRLHGVYR